MKQSTCAIDGCEKAERYKGYCSMHHSRIRRHGDPGPAQPLRGGPCTVEGCGRKREAQGLCSAHYQRMRKGQPLDLPILRSDRRESCVIDWCDSRPVGNGHCSMHYQRNRLGVDMNKPAREYVRWDTTDCAVDGCEKPRAQKAFCSGHAARYERGQNMNAPWRGDADPRDPGTWNRAVSSSGYVVLSTAVGGVKRQVAEHRWIMEQLIGRELLPEESVHHINGVRDDNRIENLELWSSSHPSGQRVVDKLAWAKSILALYEPDTLNT